MSNKANRIRQQARQRRAIACGLSDKQIEQERITHASRELLLDSEDKALLADMRACGFAPPKGMPTQKQFSRYAAFRKARARSHASALAESELAIIQAEGGVVSRILDRLNKPGLKDTAAANLTAVLLRAQSIATTNLDVDDDNLEVDLPESEHIANLIKRLGGAA